MDTLTPADIEAEGLPGWTVHAGNTASIRATAKTGTFECGLELVNRIGELAEAANHHPDITLTYPKVDVSLTTHDAGGLTRADVDLARQICTIADALGIELVPPAT